MDTFALDLLIGRFCGWPFVDWQKLFNGKFYKSLITTQFQNTDKVILDYCLKLSIRMSEAHLCDIELDNPLQCRLSRIKERKDILSPKLMAEKR